jgi:GNAT superfamily N-acetyltransferase
MEHEWKRDRYTISTDRRRLDLAAIHGFLVRSYWAEGIPRAVVARSIEHSLCFGVYEDTLQIGFARVITDQAVVALLSDVFVLEPWRGCGLGKWLVETIVSVPELQGLRRWMLVTNDAHGLYRRVGFTPPANPERLMERWTPTPTAIDDEAAPSLAGARVLS